MKAHTFSIVVGTTACNAKCPFCVSKMTLTPGTGKHPQIHWDRFETACKIVEHARDGLISVVLTGVGEPMLYPKKIDEYLVRLNGRFPLVELQTNGVSVELAAKLNWLETWKDKGLTQVSISITHTNPNRSNKIMGITAFYNYWNAVERLKEAGFSVRLNCTMLKSGIYLPSQSHDLIDLCAERGVDKLTLREVVVPSDPRNLLVAQWVNDEKPHGAAARLCKNLEMNGASLLLKLPHGGVVYDVRGQNVAVATCLTKTTNPDDIRQIIFFPDGRIAYDWQHPGARIL
jgi:molybdenum cofactor biosynthesis enzyme MoaA